MLLIIGGHPRSGTTLLQHLSNSHPDMLITHEFGNFCHLDRPYKEYRRRILMRLWNTGILRNRTLLWSTINGESRKIVKIVKGHAKANAFVARYLLEMHKHRRKLIGVAEIELILRSIFPKARIVGDKLPDYVFSLDKLVGLRGLSCLIIYRDCREVTGSTLEWFRTVERNDKHWIDNLSTAEKIAKRWVRAIELMERHAEKVHIIRYEDLIQKPEQELEALGRWLGVDPAGFQRKMIPDTSSGKHKKRLSEKELATVMEIAGPTMARLVYI